MFRISCDQCGTAVLAEKYSPRHTSVQWLGDAGEQCPHAAAETAGSSTGSPRQLCPALHATIDGAARDGVLPMTTRTEPTPGLLA
ncbi:hypothetical protein [Gordonia sp. (in: high G+C Gram-positive bacteria)]|uniref:hypothetical protein n=1 Tax=Gordonia sp. (in: high G+C Gram-positive bacteria) TaxID=84139 RepID=UPI003F952089